MPDGFWNGEPAEYFEVQIIVGDDGCFAHPWYADLIGQQREAVEVRQGDHTFYIDNDEGQGMVKVTVGRGSPGWSHRSLCPAEVIGYTMGYVDAMSEKQ